MVIKRSGSLVGQTATLERGFSFHRLIKTRLSNTHVLTTFTTTETPKASDIITRYHALRPDQRPITSFFHPQAPQPIQPPSPQQHPPQHDPPSPPPAHPPPTTVTDSGSNTPVTTIHRDTTPTHPQIPDPPQNSPTHTPPRTAPLWVPSPHQPHNNKHITRKRENLLRPSTQSEKESPHPHTNNPTPDPAPAPTTIGDKTRQRHNTKAS